MEKKYNFVYLTTNLINNKQYVGDHSTNNLNCGHTKNYKGGGKIIKEAQRKYGKENFKREILEFFSTKLEAFDAQEKYIIQYNTLSPNGYNISPTGGTYNGGCHSEKTRKKISNLKKGIKFSELHKKRLKESHLGIKQSNETIQKRIQKTTGLKRSEETKQKLRIPMSKETKEKIKNSLIGIKHSEERKQNMKKSHNFSIVGKEKWLNSHIGKIFSIETRKKLSNAKKGKPLSEQHKQRIKDSWIKRKQINLN
ncbi:MAG: NUMOD3 domain-containing DNA-binding protein [Candidatus Nanoarchaeia archaeon]|nr:NUMOD3 domain-containing DNA-binding protein [Candidatus Nanoarchaeia archaeon]